jgi:hypothetical protein
VSALNSLADINQRHRDFAFGPSPDVVHDREQTIGVAEGHPVRRIENGLVEPFPTHWSSQKSLLACALNRAIRLQKE